MGLSLSVLLVGLALQTAPAPPSIARSDESERVTLSGKVVELTDLLEADGLKVDAEPIAKQVVVRSKEGTIAPLLSDEASRAFFLDERLRNRPAELKCRKRPGNPYLQVISFKVEENGTLRTPEYYCEICTISVRFPQICPCCQGEMVLRMKPEPR